MKKTGPQIEDFDKVLVVEGYSDLHFYSEMLEHLGRHKEVFIEDMKGRSRLLDKLEAFMSAKLLLEKTHIAIVVDADDNGAGVAEGIARRLEKQTGRKLSEGIWSLGSPNLGFLVVPKPDEVGELEDLAWRALDPKRVNQTLAIEADAFVDRTKSLHPPTTTRIAKRRLGSLLAVCHEDDPRLGPAAQAKLIDFDAPALARLKAFLSSF